MSDVNPSKDAKENVFRSQEKREIDMLRLTKNNRDRYSRKEYKVTKDNADHQDEPLLPEAAQERLDSEDELHAQMASAGGYIFF
jgi:hypothetical protein